MKDQERNSKEETVIVSKSGHPYQSRGIASVQMQQKKLNDTHEVIEYNDGYAIARKHGSSLLTTEAIPEAIPEDTTPESKPDSDKVAVENNAKRMVLCPVCKLKTSEAEFGDPCFGTIVKKGTRQDCTGFFGDNPHEVKAWKWVKFSNRTSDIDPVDVTLSHNGDVLVMQRDVEVCLPVKYIEVADHALKLKWETIPGEDRKRAAHIQTFPYTIIRDGTEEEYFNQKNQKKSA